MDKDELKNLRAELKNLQERIEHEIQADQLTEDVLLQQVQSQIITHLCEASHGIHCLWRIAKD